MKKINNPPNPFQSAHRELLEPPTEAALEVYEDASRSILSRNESPDIHMRWSVNPYRGCFHSCTYCYARQYHEYLDWGAGTDFESKITIKRAAPELLRRELQKKSWKGEVITFSGATDCYQPLEAVYQLTRKCLEVCRDFRNPVGVITKGFLVTRDKDILADINKDAGAGVIVSIPFATDDLARKMEPQASTITRRFEALEILAAAGIPVGVSLAPTIPGLNDSDIPAILHRAKDAGATFAFHSMLHLQGSVEGVFIEKIKAALPAERVERILNRIRDARKGKLSDNRIGHRMRGEGTYWKSISDLFRLHQKKLKLDQFPIWREGKKPLPTPQLELPLST